LAGLLQLGMDLTALWGTKPEIVNSHSFSPSSIGIEMTLSFPGT